jgi:hypothetical protein
MGISVDKRNARISGEPQMFVADASFADSRLIMLGSCDGQVAQS